LRIKALGLKGTSVFKVHAQPSASSVGIAKIKGKVTGIRPLSPTCTGYSRKNWTNWISTCKKREREKLDFTLYHIKVNSK
jgi:hypothetical protein